MITVEDYYKTTHKTSANSKDFELVEQDFDVFPKGGIYIGEFESLKGDRLPALIPLDQTNGVCFLTTPDNEKEVKQVMQMMALRLACSIYPTKSKMILYDGQSAGNELVHLAGLSASVKGESIIDNLDGLKNKLKVVNKEISHIIQNVLGAKYADKTLVDYNTTAKELTLPYTFIIIADFPHTLDKETADLLLRIVKNGRKAGVFVMMNLDTAVGLKKDKNDLSIIDQKPFLDLMTVVYQSNTCERYYINNLIPNNPKSVLFNRFALHLDSTIPENLEDVIQYVNKCVNNAKTAKLIMTDRFTKDNLWKKDASAGVEIPIGMSNNRTIQYFSLGKRHNHCLIGGRNGSGKSVLLHNILCNGSWLYSPDELQFILLDFKDGIEFNRYKAFSNVKILSVQSDTAFALNVFRFLEDEKVRRSELFKKEGVEKLEDYNKKASQKLPRYIIIIDEFQKMFDCGFGTTTELDTRIDQLARQIRASVGNFVFCTQSLGNLSLQLSEFGLRIGLPFNSEQECRRICYDSVIPLSLETGQALYCENPDGTNPIQFRVAYLGDAEVLSMRQDIQSSGLDYSAFDRFIFDGNTPANINNIVKDEKADKNALYVGSPLSLKKEHSYFRFKREQGSNLLIIGQDVRAATSIVYYTIQQLLELVSSKDAIIICDKTSEESPTYNKLAEIHTEKCNYFYFKEDNDITTWIGSINKKIEERRTGISKEYGEVYLVLFNTFNYQPSLWREEISTTASRQLISVLQNGSNYGIHLIVYSDTYGHHLASFGKLYKYDWGIKAAVSGGDSINMFDNETREIKTEYISLFMKSGMLEDHAEKIMVYEL